MKSNVIVLGAGPAGLAFSHRFGKGATILEKSGNVGGLSRSVNFLDGTFDIGGHSFHTPHQEVHQLVRSLMGSSWVQQSRDARVWVSGEMIPYPFQHHFNKLKSIEVVQDCLDHQANHENANNADNFQDWIQHRFGTGVAEHFMLPYNRKLWARDLTSMTCDWVNQRVATEKKSEDVAGIRQPLQSDSQVAYPAEGGFGTIFETLADHCHRIELNQDVCRIDLDKHIVQSRSEHSWSWKRIVSTMPLPHLLNVLSNCPPQLKQLASELEAVSLKILMLLIKPAIESPPQRVYISDPEIPAHKVAFNHTSSPSLRERDHHAVMCEVSYSPFKPVANDEYLLNTMGKWLLDAQYISHESDVIETRVIDVPLGYPVNTPNKTAIVSKIQRFLNELDIYSIGRFGAWDYANSDECIRQGLVLADNLPTARNYKEHILGH